MPNGDISGSKGYKLGSKSDHLNFICHYSASNGDHSRIHGQCSKQELSMLKKVSKKTGLNKKTDSGKE